MVVPVNACSGWVGWGLPGGQERRLQAPSAEGPVQSWSANWNLHAAPRTQPACRNYGKKDGLGGQQGRKDPSRVLTQTGAQGTV